MKILSTKSSDTASILRQLRQKRSRAEDVRERVGEILAQVQSQGDRALRSLTERFDGLKLSSFQVSKQELSDASRSVSRDVRRALQYAKNNIEAFHKKMLRPREKSVTTRPGVTVWREFRPIESVGLYVPGGKAAYPSTVLMLGVPAAVAGCREVVLCTPAAKDGTVNPAVLVAAELCGITKIYKLGGAQAIAAMAYGTETIPQVSKIFGPGNQYVTTAKMMVYGDVDIDMPAGPSEVAVLADDSANPAWVAADLLSQLEHGEDSQAVLVAFNKAFAEQVIGEMQKQMVPLPRRNMVEQSYAKSFVVLVRSSQEACEILNGYAPEHLELVVQQPSRMLPNITNVGSVFLGPYSSEPLGDYATGANHTLPTSEFAKMFSPLSTDSFGKMIQVQMVTKAGITHLRKTAETLADIEGLDAHKNAVTIRFT